MNARWTIKRCLRPMRRFQIISDYRDEIYECLSTNDCTIRCCDAIYDWTLRMVNDTLPWTRIDDSYETVHWSFTDESDASLYKCLEIMFIIEELAQKCQLIVSVDRTIISPRMIGDVDESRNTDESAPSKYQKIVMFLRFASDGGDVNDSKARTRRS